MSATCDDALAEARSSSVIARCGAISPRTAQGGRRRRSAQESGNQRRAAPAARRKANGGRGTRKRHETARLRSVDLRGKGSGISRGQSDTKPAKLRAETMMPCAARAAPHWRRRTPEPVAAVKGRMPMSPPRGKPRLATRKLPLAVEGPGRPGLTKPASILKNVSAAGRNASPPGRSGADALLCLLQRKDSNRAALSPSCRQAFGWWRRFSVRIGP